MCEHVANIKDLAIKVDCGDDSEFVPCNVEYKVASYSIY